MNIVYLHGFGSSFKPEDKKVRALKKLGPVTGFDIDYSLSFDELIESTLRKIGHADLIVGTSMGGWLASRIGALCGVPFVAINPALEPSKSLLHTTSMTEDYSGKPLRMVEESINTFKDFDKSGCGLILLDSGDELFESTKTATLLEPFYHVEMFDGGSHRFEHMEDSLEAIENFYDLSGMVYGLSDV